MVVGEQPSTPAVCTARVLAGRLEWVSQEQVNQCVRKDLWESQNRMGKKQIWEGDKQGQGECGMGWIQYFWPVPDSIPSSSNLPTPFLSLSLHQQNSWCRSAGLPREREKFHLHLGNQKQTKNLHWIQCRLHTAYSSASYDCAIIFEAARTLLVLSNWDNMMGQKYRFFRIPPQHAATPTLPSVLWILSLTEPDT